jgi:ABC-type transport system involved in cytochrome bd biosynthesis fused ATPase/permease subunit
LTRIFHILNSLSGLVYQVLDFTAMSARVQVLLDAERRFIEPTALPEAPYGQVLVNDSPVHQYESVVEVIRNSKSGRFTIRGANGSGKSTLLHVLKKALSCEAILVPCHHGKLHWRSTSTTQSTGQRSVSQLLEISSHPEVRYLLLDEWDANLDAANTHAVDQILERFSKDRVVIEIRH